MASSTLRQQYFYRGQKDIGLANGSPSYDACLGFEKPGEFARASKYSPDGRLFAYVLPKSVRILNTTTSQVQREIPIEGVIELGFSPRATFISTWERPLKQEDGQPLYKNMRVWDVESGEEQISFYQKGQEGWELQFTSSESHALRLAGPEIQVYKPSSWSTGISDKLRIEGISTLVLSPGPNPSIAVFVPEKKGAPASISIHNLSTLAAPPACRKQFFKADRVQVKWNSLGTLALFMTQTEVDKSNKSYYGETGLYLLSAAGNFDSRITLDKDGPIHDFAWNPNSKEFGIIYGYMPAKTTLFDARVKPVYEFGFNPYNFISWNPQGRLLALAGFGNLAGKVDVYDRKTLNKVVTIDAPNTTFFDWSHDGLSVLTATLSPRLRVDNGLKVWHCSGVLLHVHMQDELYQTGWRPLPVGQAPPFPAQIPAAPAQSESARAIVASKPVAVKPAGAYRPPGALGRAAPDIFKREEESPAPSPTPPLGGGHQNGYGRGSGGVGRGARGGAGPRYVPGAPPPAQSPPPNEGEKRRKNKSKKREDGPNSHSHNNPHNDEQQQHPRSRPATSAGYHNRSQSRGGERAERPGILQIPEPLPVRPGTAHAVLSPTATEPVTPGGEGGLDPVQKKIRNLNKKLKAIEELKDKAKRGEKLEGTQYKKIETEAEIRKELASVMAAA